MALNKKVCGKISSLFPNTKFNIYSHYVDIVKSKICAGNVILDIGGGKKCVYATDRQTDSYRIIGIDISDDELKLNSDVDERIVADITKSIPLDDSSIDIVTSSSVLEHLRDLESSVKEISRILRSGGIFISVLPNKFALFAIINQCLPHFLSRKILFKLHPEAKGIGGFKAYYNRCYFAALSKLLRRNGFEDVEFVFNYNQSGYFSFFVPCFLMSIVWDYFMYLLGMRNLCAYVCFAAKKQ
ncbi:MAG: class I SAM-dependent methyltransferase [Synergistaceae bacterium]|jgi:ubiquinone/menaquinone biosynthesis C-methylase UbiE|nr:class I SAM-dependent methyltransferase [Synergistaceae bacterium]